MEFSYFPWGGWLQGVWVWAASAQVSKEKLDELKGVHVPVKKP